MRKRRYVLPKDDSNRIRVEPKESVRSRGEPSPDRLDTIVMLFSSAPVLGTLVDEKQRDLDTSACGIFSNCFKNQEREEEGSFVGVWGDN
jgi:hypothetical protein